MTGETTVLVAVEDGKPGCPEPVWYDGLYGPYRCGFGALGECHQHGRFEVVPVEDFEPSDDVAKVGGISPQRDGDTP